MYTYKSKKLPRNTFEILLSIPKEDIQTEYDKVFEKHHAELQVEGFRKGKAPRSIAEKMISKDAVYKDLLQSLLSKIYEEIVKKDSLKPVVTPKIELVKAKENEQWEIKLTLAEKPHIELKNFKEEVRKAKSNQKKEDIWVPGKEQKNDPKQNENKQKLLNTVLDAVLKTSVCEISDMILEDELNHRLSRLVDDVQKIGLTTESYLKSKSLTMDQLKAQYRKEIEDTYKLEFVLSEIAEQEKITVDKADIEKLLSQITDPKERVNAEQNAYYYASILRKQKTLDYLMAL